MVNSINSHQPQLLRTQQPESIGEREHDGDTDDSAAMGSIQGPQKQFQFGTGVGVHLNIMA